MRIRLRQGMVVLWCLAFLLLLAACAPAGSATNNSQTGQASATVPGQVTPTATATPRPTPGSQARNGCSTQQPPADAQQQADVVVTEKGNTGEQPVTLNMGQTLEVRLPANTRWRMSAEDATGALKTNEATGWYDATLKVCRWRFTAVGTGSATLSFAGILICTPKGQCPVAALLQQFTITVR